MKDPLPDRLLSTAVAIMLTVIVMSACAITMMGVVFMFRIVFKV